MCYYRRYIVFTVLPTLVPASWHELHECQCMPLDNVNFGHTRVRKAAYMLRGKSGTSFSGPACARRGRIRDSKRAYSRNSPCCQSDIHSHSKINKRFASHIVMPIVEEGLYVTHHQSRGRDKTVSRVLAHARTHMSSKIYRSSWNILGSDIFCPNVIQPSVIYAFIYV